MFLFDFKENIKIRSIENINIAEIAEKVIQLYGNFQLKLGK